ncbi:Clavaminate synthase-like protein [Hypoxylon sp. FL1284]|nr:Clavaminate synthase-like protein [Hypoxylon sp. FL1284]
MTAHTVPLASASLGNLPCLACRQGQRLTADILARQQSTQQSTMPQPPLGFPGFLDGPGNWSGSDSNESPVSIFSLFESEVTEIKAGWKGFCELELDGDEATPARFLLPGLRSRLEQCALDVHYGSGICIIRGLDHENYSVEDSTIIFLALASYIGDQRGLQSLKGDMLSHVTESKSWAVPRARRHGIHTNAGLPFHNDMGCEILCMQIRDQADTGGHTCVASITAIYNDLLRSNPWALHVLAEHNWPIQSSSKKDPPFVLSPLLEFHAGNLLVSMDPARIGPHPLSRSGSIPSLTPEQQDALAALQKAAQKHQIQLQTQPGDIVFLNNLSLLHARESYSDGATSSRHLVRLWLRNSELGWPIPPSMKMPWDAAFGDRAMDVIDRYYPIVPMPEYMECKYSNGTAAFVAGDDSDSDDGHDGHDDKDSNGGKAAVETTETNTGPQPDVASTMQL